MKTYTIPDVLVDLILDRSVLSISTEISWPKYVHETNRKINLQG